MSERQRKIWFLWLALAGGIFFLLLLGLYVGVIVNELARPVQPPAWSGPPMAMNRSSNQVRSGQQLSADEETTGSVGAKSETSPTSAALAAIENEAQEFLQQAPPWVDPLARQHLAKGFQEMLVALQDYQQNKGHASFEDSSAALDRIWDQYDQWWSEWGELWSTKPELFTPTAGQSGDARKAAEQAYRSLRNWRQNYQRIGNVLSAECLALYEKHSMWRQAALYFHAKIIRGGTDLDWNLERYYWKKLGPRGQGMIALRTSERLFQGSVTIRPVGHPVLFSSAVQHSERLMAL